MRLNEISDNSGAHKRRMRIGRGIGSGKGKTGGRGVKGQKSRTGVRIKGFEGGQMPIHRRLPKRGFNKPNQLRYEEINLGDLQTAVDAKKLDAGKLVDIAALKAAGLVRGNRDGVRLLGNGKLSVKLEIQVTGASSPAIAAVEKLGGKVQLPPVLPPFEKKGKAKAKQQS